MDELSRPSQNDGSERITAENMALLCSKNIKLDLEPIKIPDTTVREVGAVLLHGTVIVFLLNYTYYLITS